MALPTDNQIYTCHVENLRALQVAQDSVAKLARKAIATDDKATIQSLVRLYAFLLGAWAECRLKKLLFESNGFSGEDRAKIESQKTQLGQWKLAVELAFRKRYNVPNAALSASNITFTGFARYKELILILDTDLQLVIEIRNKLAHGQWIHPFNNACTNIEPRKKQLLDKENLQSLIFKVAMITQLAELVHDLVVSTETFDRDFDTHYKILDQARTNLNTRPYSEYASRLVSSYEKGKLARVASSNRTTLTAAA